MMFSKIGHYFPHFFSSPKRWPQKSLEYTIVGHPQVAEHLGMSVFLYLKQTIVINRGYSLWSLTMVTMVIVNNHS